MGYSTEQETYLSTFVFHYVSSASRHTSSCTLPFMSQWYLHTSTTLCRVTNPTQEAIQINYSYRWLVHFHPISSKALIITIQCHGDSETGLPYLSTSSSIIMPSHYDTCLLYLNYLNTYWRHVHFITASINPQMPHPKTMTAPSQNRHLLNKNHAVPSEIFTGDNPWWRCSLAGIK